MFVWFDYQLRKSIRINHSVFYSSRIDDIRWSIFYLFVTTMPVAFAIFAVFAFAELWASNALLKAFTVLLAATRPTTVAAFVVPECRGVSINLQLLRWALFLLIRSPTSRNNWNFSVFSLIDFNLLSL